MVLYLVVPILTSRADTANPICNGWYGLKYHESISNRLAPEDKERQYEFFENASRRQFDVTDLAQFAYLDRIGNTDDHTGYRGAIARNTTFPQGTSTVLVPIDQPYESRNGDKFAWIFGSFGIGAAVWLIMILIPKLDETNLKKRHRSATSKSDAADFVKTVLIPRNGFFITPIIAELNVLIFLCMVFAGLGLFSFDASDLLAWGADSRPAVSQGQWWRLVTSMFLHGGLMHLVANLYGLFLVGFFLEPVLGRTKYAVVYLVTGVLASLSSLWWHPTAVSVGASGAIFGLYGAFLALIVMKVYSKDFSKAFLPMVLIFIGYNIIAGLNGAVDNAAHIGGLISGFLIGALLSGTVKREEQIAVE
jgi:membrane associated rhomboid family serine protease